MVHFLHTCISAYFITVYAAYSVFEEIFNASFSLRFIRQGAPLDFGVFLCDFCAFLQGVSVAASPVLATIGMSVRLSVRLSVRHTLVLSENDAS